MDLLITISVFTLFIGFCITMMLSCRKSERKSWNNGICPKCGENLTHFDTDSQGGEGWGCDKCNYITWVSYKKYVYKKNNNERI